MDPVPSPFRFQTRAELPSSAMVAMPELTTSTLAVVECAAVVEEVAVVE